MNKGELFEGALIKHDGKPCMVKGLFQEQLLVSNHKTNEEQMVAYSEVEPIRLTLEFFAKIGCSIRERKDVDESKIAWDDGKLNVKYVHQFQRLLKDA